MKVSPTSVDSLDRLADIVGAEKWRVTTCCTNIGQALRESKVPSHHWLGEAMERAADRPSPRTYRPDMLRRIGNGENIAAARTRMLWEMDIRESLLDKYVSSQIFKLNWKVRGNRNVHTLAKTSLGNPVVTVQKKSKASSFISVQCREGHTKGHIVSECFLPLSVRFGLGKASGFREAVNARIMQLREAGLIDKWMRDGMELMGNLVVVKSREATEATPLGLEPLKGPFYLTALTLAMAMLLFVAEVVGVICALRYKRREKKRKQLAWAK